MEQVIKHFKELLLDRQEKLEKLSQKNISTERERDEIQDDFLNDPRRKAYHDLRKSVKGDSAKEKEFMKYQDQIFNNK
ncbi:MAG: hypothetical protein K9H12_12470 [Bacteroidales bacterium]|nr:hypothetical protein [Bacteroidales bacterium]